MAENKVQFGLKNVYYAILTEESGSAPSWGTPKHVEGAVNISLAHETAQNDFYADNVAYYTTSQNNGYTGSLEMAKIPEAMLKDVFGFGVDTTYNIMFESANVEPKPFALLFEIDGDDANERYLIYRCIATRPPINSQTVDENGKEPQTQTIDIKCLPVHDTTSGSTIDGKVTAKTTAATTATVKNTWFTEVFTDFA